MNYKNENGSFNSFEMKGGTYEGFLTTLNEINCQMNKCIEALRKMEIEDIDGTVLAHCAMLGLYNKLYSLQERMGLYRANTFGTNKNAS